MDKIKRDEISVFLGAIGFFGVLYLFTHFLINNDFSDILVYGYWHYLWIGIGVFIGIALHELGHAVFCHIVGVKVYKIKFFNNDKSDADGYVIHETPKSLFQSLMIIIGPIFIVGLFNVITLFMALSLKAQHVDFYFAWTFLGYGMFFGLFPSTWDVNIGFKEVNKRIKHNFLVGIFYPLLAVLWIVSIYFIRIVLLVIILSGIGLNI